MISLAVPAFYSLGTRISSATNTWASSQCACVPGRHGVEQPQQGRTHRVCRVGHGIPWGAAGGHDATARKPLPETMTPTFCRNTNQQQQQQAPADDDQLAELWEIFRSFNRNNDGSLTQLELGSLLRSLGLKPSADQLDALIQRADTNSNGLVEFSEFVALVALDLLDDRSPYSEDQLHRLFGIFDRDGNGFITAAELAHSMAKLRLQLARRDLVDDTLWTGVPGNYTDPKAPAALAVVRKLVDDGQFVDATKAASGLFGGPTEVVEIERTAVEEAPRFRWDGFGSDLSEPQKEAIRGLSPKLPGRCKALMTRIVCLSPQDENLGALLAFWVKAMKPKRADWLLVLKELKAMESPLLAEVLEYALLEDSFEANVRDYTKLIHIYGKQKLLRKAENTFHAMKGRGFPCDQVILTALMDMYSKAGDLTRTKEIFEEIVLLGLPLDKRAYGSMTMAYIRADMLDKAEDLIKQMDDQQIFAGKEVYKALLRAYSYKGDSDGAQRVFDAIQFAGIVPDTKLCALLVNAYCLSCQIDEAVCVIQNMRSAGLRPCDKCIALILGAYEKANGLERALAFLTELEENGVVIGQEPSQLLAGWFRRIGVVHEVEQVLKDISEDGKSKHSFAVSLEQK